MQPAEQSRSFASLLEQFRARNQRPNAQRFHRRGNGRAASAETGAAAAVSEIFISYSHKDEASATALQGGLEKNGRKVWRYVDEPHAGANFRREIAEAIDAADALLFLVSQSSVESIECRLELTYAVSKAKKIIPIILEDVAQEKIPHELRDLTWFYFSRTAAGGGGPDEKMAKLLLAIDRDNEWFSFHTYLTLRCDEWEESDRSSSNVLRGRELRDARAWLQEVDPEKGFVATPEQLHYIEASRKARQWRRAQGLTAALGILVVLAEIALVAMVRNDAYEAAKHTGDETGLQLATRTAFGFTDWKLFPAQKLGVVTKPIALLRDALLGSQLESVLRGHDRPVQSVAFDSSGRYLVSASRDGSARLWDVDDGEQISILRQSKHPLVYLTAFDSQHDRLAIAVGDDVEIWRQIRTPNRLGAPWHACRNLISKLAFDPGGAMLGAACGDGSAWLFDTETDRKVTLGDGKGDASFVFGPGSSNAVATWRDRDKAVDVWRVGSGQQLGSFGASGQVRSAAISPNGRLLAIAGTGHKPRIWDVNEHRIRGDPPRHGGQINTIDFSPDSELVLTSSKDGRARVFRARTGEKEAALVDPTRANMQGAWFSPNGRTVVTVDEGGLSLLWRVGTWDELSVLRGHEGPILDAAFSPDSQQVATVGSDDDVRVWRVGSGDGVAEELEDVVSASFSPDGSILAAGSSDGVTHLWDTASWTELARLGRAAAEDETRLVSSTSFSSDCRYLATVSMNEVQIWDLQANAKDRSPQVAGKFAQADFAPASHRLLAWDSDHIELFDPFSATGTRIQLALQGIHAAALSSDDTLLATGDEHGGRLWSVGADAFTPLGDATLGSNPVSSLAFHPDGKSLLTGGTKGEIRLWDTAHRAVEAELRHPAAEAIAATAFSADGAMAAAGENIQNGKVEVWKTKSGEDIAELMPGRGAVAAVRFSPDGRYLLTVHSDWSARVYRNESFLPFGDLLRIACHRLVGRQAALLDAGWELGRCKSIRQRAAATLDPSHHVCEETRARLRGLGLGEGSATVATR
jgi:WD40 repeat protein